MTVDNTEISKKEILLRGKKRAMHLLERKDYSRKELCDKLRRGDYPEAVIAEILEYLDGFHYLDDARVAGTYIRGRKESKSRRELEYLLKQKGIAEDIISEAMAENYKTEDGGSQEEAAIMRQLQKLHMTEETLSDMTYEQKQKAAAKLYRKGFSHDKIIRALHL